MPRVRGRGASARDPQGARARAGRKIRFNDSGNDGKDGLPYDSSHQGFKSRWNLPSTRCYNVGTNY